MKGISEVIALILMLVITIALAGTAYLYISGIFTTQTQAIEVADSFCDSSGMITFSIRNDGTNPLTGITCVATAPTGTSCGFNTSFPAVNIQPGAVQTFASVVNCTGTSLGPGSARSCQYRLTPSAGRTISTQVTCT